MAALLKRVQFMKRLPLVLLAVAITVTVIAVAAWYRYTHPIIVTTQPATAPLAKATRPATTRLTARKTTGPATQLLEIVRAANPGYPTTQRLEEGLDLKYAARILLDSPVHLDGQGYLWLTRADAPDPFPFLQAGKAQAATLVTRDRVEFVLWSPTENGLWMPHLVVRHPDGAGWQLVDYQGQRDLPDTLGFHWERAVVLYGPRGVKDRIVVPTNTGVVAFTFDQPPDAIHQAHHPLFDRAVAEDRAVHLVLDTSGVIAYTTNAAGTLGAKGMARFAAPQGSNDHRWTNLTPASGWPDNLVYLVPLLDGSVLQIATDPAEKDKVAFSINSIEAVAIDELKVLKLVAQLSSSKLEKREEAFKELTQYGPGIAPLLEKTLEDADPEAKIRLQMLLKNKIEPSLGGMSLVDGKMRVVSRFKDGGILFYSEAGVAIPRPDDDPAYVTPAFLSLRPGRAVDLLPPALVNDLNPDKQKVIAWRNEYIVQDPLFGPQRFIGNGLEPLLEKKYRRFNRFVGIDQTGRWIFRSTFPTTRPATTQATTDTRSSPIFTLILDPHLPDPTPRLPGWQLPISAGNVGWDKNGWPVIFMENQPKAVPWALEEFAWRVIEEDKEKVFTDPTQIAKPPPATTRAASKPVSTTTAATSQASTQELLPAGECLLETPDGLRYYGGNETLTVMGPAGRTDWVLPTSAVGKGKPILLRTRDNLLFLINAPGRITRLRPTPDAAEPFEVQAVFTRKVPTDPAPLRVWLDPADRICFAHDKDRITVLFPSGRIPPEIARLMPAEQAPADEE